MYVSKTMNCCCLITENRVRHSFTFQQKSKDQKHQKNEKAIRIRNSQTRRYFFTMPNASAHMQRHVHKRTGWSMKQPKRKPEIIIYFSLIHSLKRNKLIRFFPLIWEAITRVIIGNYNVALTRVHRDADKWAVREIWKQNSNKLNIALEIQ